MNRKEFAKLIINRLNDQNIDDLQKNFKKTSPINHIVIENLLPTEIAAKLDSSFPEKNNLKLRSETQERKYSAVEWDVKSKIIEECLYSFQDKKVIKAISKISKIDDLSGDPELYAGGVSYMDKDCFLNPHIDNSHDRLRERYRRLNLLYYVSIDWNINKNGGELMLFPNGIKSTPVLIPPIFNSLVIMRTDNKSLHGVSKINSNDAARKCISNYYFSHSSPLGKNYYHSTSFRGFKGEKIKDYYFRFNSLLRTSIKSSTGNLFGRIFNTGHHRKK